MLGAFAPRLESLNDGRKSVSGVLCDILNITIDVHKTKTCSMPSLQPWLWILMSLWRIWQQVYDDLVISSPSSISPNKRKSVCLSVCLSISPKLNKFVTSSGSNDVVSAGSGSGKSRNVGFYTNRRGRIFAPQAGWCNIRSSVWVSLKKTFVKYSNLDQIVSKVNSTMLCIEGLISAEEKQAIQKAKKGEFMGFVKIPDSRNCFQIVIPSILLKLRKVGLWGRNEGKGETKHTPQLIFTEITYGSRSID